VDRSDRENSSDGRSLDGVQLGSISFSGPRSHLDNVNPMTGGPGVSAAVQKMEAHAHNARPEMGRVFSAELGGEGLREGQGATLHLGQSEIGCSVTPQVVSATAVDVSTLVADVPVVQGQLVHLAEAMGMAWVGPAPSPSSALQGLIAGLDGATSDSSRMEILDKYLRRVHLERSALATTCAEVALIAQKFMLSTRKREALRRLYPLLPPEEQAGFAAMLEHVLPFSWDRQELLRAVSIEGNG